jgi:energy-coupling factor transporter transmembrane protein EcfT
MGETLFRGGCLENKETKTLFRTLVSMLVVFVIGMFILGMFVLAILLSYGLLSYPSVDLARLLPILTFLGALCSVSGAALIISLQRYRKKARVEVTSGGVSFGGRLVRWGDVGDVKAWSESFREAEVEGSPVVGYGMYGYAYGKTLPSTVTYRSHKYVVLQVFHRNGVGQHTLRSRSTGHS